MITKVVLQCGLLDKYSAGNVWSMVLFLTVPLFFFFLSIEAWLLSFFSIDHELC